LDLFGGAETGHHLFASVKVLLRLGQQEVVDDSLRCEVRGKNPAHRFLGQGMQRHEREQQAKDRAHRSTPSARYVTLGMGYQRQSQGKVMDWGVGWEGLGMVDGR